MARVWIAALVMALFSGPAMAGLQEALRAAGQDDWSRAAQEARADGGTAPLIVEWLRLRDREGGADFAAYRGFLANYPDWPGLDLLHQRGEAAINARTPAAHVIAYFADATPKTPNGAYWLARALADSGQQTTAQEALTLAWRTLSFSSQDQALWLERYRSLLAPHHAARMDDTLWRRAWGEADRMRPLVDPGWRALASAREGLAKDRDGVDGLIAAVPAALQGDPGLAYERMAWRMRKERFLSAAELMQSHSASRESLGRPEAWADRRRRLARQLMRDGDYREAYLIASQHHLTQAWPYSDLEWIAGYVALRFLDAPAAGLSHFQRLRAAVDSPISLGRAGYWEGRAYEAMGQAEQARAAYSFGAEYQTSFYGQLAAERAGIGPDPRLAGGERFPDGANGAFRQSTVYQAGVSLHNVGNLGLSARFFAHLAEGMPRDQIGSMAARLEVLKAPYLRLSIAKRAASEGHMLHKAYFPMYRISTGATPKVTPELALAIARRESEFNHTVVSPAGAMGLMQVMPGTAKLMAPVIGEPYNRARLTRDPGYNGRLGTAYLQRLHEEFGGSVVLVAAGYNAGPGRPRAWMKRYGDPRGGAVDPIDWIEHIPFRETRNYVMRVTESLAPYRARLSGQAQPLGLTDLLRAR